MTTSDISGSCAGHAVATELPFRILRDGTAGHRLAIRRERGETPGGEVVAVWEPRPLNPFHGRLLRDGERFAFWASDAGWFAIDPRQAEITLVDVDGDLEVDIDGGGRGPAPLTLTAEVRLFGVPATLVALEQGDVALHAAAVEIDGRAVVLTGPSRQGKTTLAAAFEAAGHRLLTEDMTRCTPGAAPAVHPGPAVVRLRPDVAGGLDMRGAATEVTERERVFRLLDGPARGSGAPVPLAAILFLRESPGGARLAAANPVDAIRDLWTLAFHLPTDASRGAAFARVGELAVAVPVLDLHRELRLDTLPEVIALVERLVATGTPA